MLFSPEQDEVNYKHLPFKLNVFLRTSVETIQFPLRCILVNFEFITCFHSIYCISQFFFKTFIKKRKNKENMSSSFHSIYNNKPLKDTNLLVQKAINSVSLLLVSTGLSEYVKCHKLSIKLCYLFRLMCVEQREMSSCMK